MSARPRIEAPSGALGALSRARRPTSVIIGVACVSYLGHVLWTRRNAIGQALELDLGTLGLLLLLVFASHCQRAFEFDYMLKRLGVRETFREGFLLTGAVALLNYLPFSAGSVARAVTLRRTHSLSYTHYASALVVATVVNGTVSALAALSAVLALRHSGAEAPLLAVFGALAAGGALVLSFPATWAPPGRNRLAARARDVVQALSLIRHRGEGLAVLSATSLGKIALNALRMWVCFLALGVRLAPLEVALLGSTLALASVLNLAPGNLGVRELVLGGVWGLVSGSPTLGIAAASLDRAVWMAYTIAVGLPGMAYVRRALTESGQAGRAPAPPTPRA